MESEIIVALAPFYVAGVAATWYGTCWLGHKLAKLDQSADETATTEKVNPSIVPK